MLFVVLYVICKRTDYVKIMTKYAAPDARKLKKKMKLKKLLLIIP